MTKDFNTVWAGLGFEDDGLRVRAALSNRKIGAAAEPPVEGNVLTTARELMPNRVGTVLKYQIRSPDPDYTSAEFKILPPEEDADPSAIRSTTIHRGPGETVTEFTHEVHNEDGLATLYEHSDDYVSRYSKPFVELPATIVENQTTVFEYAGTIKYEDNEEESSGFGEIRMTPVGREDVTVPAGTFKDCVRVDSINHSSYDGHLDFARSTTWYKEGIGVIKMISTTSDGLRTSELTEHHIPEEK